MGRLPFSQGFSYLLTMVDRTTNWREMALLTSFSTVSCGWAFLSTCVSRFGVPAILTSDRGALFTSFIWTRVCSSLGISASTTTSFHPQSNGMIEPFHHFLKSTLCFCLADSDWLLHLPLVLLVLRSAPKDDTGLSVSKAIYGAPLTVPGEFLGSPESSFLCKIKNAVAGF